MRAGDAWQARSGRKPANTAKTGLSNHVPMTETSPAAVTDTLGCPRSPAQATATIYNPGDGIFIPSGPEHKHMGRALTDLVRAVFVEEV